MSTKTIDEYCQLGENTSYNGMEYMKDFVKAFKKSNLLTIVLETTPIKEIEEKQLKICNSLD